MKHTDEETQFVSFTDSHTELFKITTGGVNGGLCLHRDPNYLKTSLATGAVLVFWPHNVCHVSW